MIAAAGVKRALASIRRWVGGLFATNDARAELDLNDYCPHVELGACDQCRSDFVAENGM